MEKILSIQNNNSMEEGDPSGMKALIHSEGEDSNSSSTLINEVPII